MAAEFPTLVNKVPQGLFVREHKDQAVLVQAEAEASLNLNHLHKRLATGTLVESHALAGRAAGEEELDAKSAEDRVAGRALHRPTRARRELISEASASCAISLT
ncbi:MAG: hypothetical protein ABI607_02695 [Betaproteobacteria bacterium]